MRRMYSSAGLLLILRVTLGIILVCAGLIKAHNVQSFADSIATFQMLPNGLINLLALSMPPFEVVIGAMLLVGWQTRAAAFAAILVLAVFISAFSQALIRGLNVDCGCFGSEGPSYWKSWGALGRDSLLLPMAVWVYVQLNYPNAPKTSC